MVITELRLSGGRSSSPAPMLALPRPIKFRSVDDAYDLLCVGGVVASIVIFKVDHVGDFALALNALTRLRRSFPGARITFVCGPWNVRLAMRSGLFDEVCGMTFFSARADGPAILLPPALPESVRRQTFDLAIDFRVDDDTRVLLDSVTARFRFGFAASQNISPLTVALATPDASSMPTLGMHQAVTMDLLAGTVIDFFKPDRAAAAGALRDLVQPAETDLLFADTKLLVVINTSSGRAVKNWPLDRFTRLINWLCRTLDVCVLLVGTGDQREDADHILGVCDTPNLRSVVGETSLAQALWLIDQADLYIGNDTGLTHFAAGLGTTTVAIFSGIDPTEAWAPRGRDVTVIKTPVPCSPCHILLLEDCRHDHACIASIDFQFVRAVVRNKLMICDQSVKRNQSSTAVAYI